MSIPSDRDQALLLDMLDSAETIEDAIAHVDLDEFIADRIFRGGVLHELTIIGEAANQLTSELRARYSDVPWRDIIDFRNLIVHGYSGLTWERVWGTVTLNVPALRTQIAGILAAEFPEEG